MLDELVELEHRAPRWVRRGVGAQLADQRTLRHLLESERSDDLVDVRLFADDEINGIMYDFYSSYATECHRKRT
jgi:hypothetical protein